ncbi:hypothetical protein SDC9_134651 [bioreactor metagenome]|uniref:Uncharacterized protein n=1 Tax=bioreactor metagenome TaxID=1076179 RepID=A0A645DG47_9ZZZZ
MFAGKRVGVVAIGQQHHFDVHTLFEQHIDTADGSLDARHITVIQYRNVVGETMNETNLSRRKRSSRRRNHVFNARLVHGNHVGVTFHQETTILFNNGLFGKVDTVEFGAFVVYFRFGRVNVLRHFVVLFQNTTTKGHHFPRKGMYGKHYTTPETIGKVTIVAFEG